ncbi:serine protease gd-like [Temnothorax curvispinosus]|uniref:Serine protease gd-like n=1 Tax=Temnothorax curvispinosus TaxID=300111 RepID=A0A6J1PFG5_9HYME|nr:serine protease gd-like [Temnothorax curvispinosus]
MIKISILSVLLPHLVYTIVRSTTEIIQERNTNNNNNNDECGITSYYTDSTNSLIPNSEYALPGQWPWVVALNVDDQFGFRCAGSILTNIHILTAAKCLEMYNAQYDIMKVAFGQFKLRRFKYGFSRIVGTVNRKIASYKIHPDFVHTSENATDSDLVILTLNTPVKFSAFIRPICLWSGLTDLQNVVDRTGYVVGWVRNKYYSRKPVSEPRMLRIPIVSQETCLRSDQDFGSITSNRTFCAGLLGESNFCDADGSGLVLFNNSTGRYHLRGVLSEYFMDLSYSCNVNRYSVYVDVAKYLPWIHQQISIT